MCTPGVSDDPVGEMTLVDAVVGLVLFCAGALCLCVGGVRFVAWIPWWEQLISVACLAVLYVALSLLCTGVYLLTYYIFVHRPMRKAIDAQCKAPSRDGRATSSGSVGGDQGFAAERLGGYTVVRTGHDREASR